MSARRAIIIHSDARAIIAKVYHFLQSEYHFLRASNKATGGIDLTPLTNIRARTAEATGVGERSVTTILKEEKKLPSPTSRFPSPKPGRYKARSGDDDGDDGDSKSGDDDVEEIN